MTWAHRIPTTADIHDVNNWHQYVPGQANSVLSYTSAKATYTIEQLVDLAFEAPRWLVCWGVPNAVRLAKLTVCATRELAVTAAADHHEGIAGDSGAATEIMPVRWGGRDVRQRQIMNWAKAAFGVDEATALPQRGLRLLEEAIEAFQACGGDEEIAHKLVGYVFTRPKGEIGQELGGVAVTALILAEAAGLSAEEEECREVRRVLSKPTSHFTARNASKNAAGFKIGGG